MPKSFFIAMMLLAYLVAGSHAFAYALIDLAPGSSMPALTQEAETSSESEVELSETVAVVSKQKGHLLALVPVNFRVKVVAWADGKVDIDYPWYSFMTISRREEFETTLKAGIDNVRKSIAVGSVKAAGKSINPKFTLEEAQIVEEKINEILNQYSGEE